MLHTPSVAGLVSSLRDESSATGQTEMHTNEAPKHVPRVNIKSVYTWYIRLEEHGVED